MPTILITPIYGWGWIVAGEPRFEVPDPFTIRLEDADDTWVGIVLDEGHEFQGRRVTLSQRHVEWDGYVNIKIMSSDPTGQSSIGFGTIARLSSKADR